MEMENIWNQRNKKELKIRNMKIKKNSRRKKKNNSEMKSE